MCQSFIACTGDLLPGAECGNCWWQSRTQRCSVVARSSPDRKWGECSTSSTDPPVAAFHHAGRLWGRRRQAVFDAEVGAEQVELVLTGGGALAQAEEAVGELFPVQERPHHGQEVVERHQQRPAQRHSDGLLGWRQRRLHPVRPVAAIMHTGEMLPLEHGSARSSRTAPPAPTQAPCSPGSPPAPWVSSPGCADGSACPHPAATVPRNRSCHDQRRPPRGDVILRDGTCKFPVGHADSLRFGLDSVGRYPGPSVARERGILIYTDGHPPTRPSTRGRQG